MSSYQYTFTAFLYNYQTIEKNNRYYYDDLDFNGGIIKESNIFFFVNDYNKNFYYIIERCK